MTKGDNSKRKRGAKHKPSKHGTKLARALARSENVYGGKRDKGLKR